MRRPRGPGGRFLTVAEIAELEKQKGQSQQNGSNSSQQSIDNPLEALEAEPLTQQL